ncbi:MAG: 2-oxoacid:ferredoxin oxidoreductase subunit beta [Proteobacteria bacterium]|nr:2-oxoacid:ferredoxin oxidoreductase subunit beta [Pseudomonadota bacterium]
MRELPGFDPADLKAKVAEDHGLHPMDVYLKPGRIPHIWCAGCGLGVVLSCFAQGLKRAGLEPRECAVVSGIGCTGRTAGYLNMDTYHTTHGRAIPFATGLKLSKPDMSVHVISGDGDLFAIGGNHMIHAARRNIDLKVLCVNNFNYGMTGGQVAPTTPIDARTTTSPYGNREHPFNLPHMAHAAGAVYVARWTSFHARQLVVAISETLQKKGFTFIEVIAPCPTGYGRPNKLGSGLDEMKFYRENSVVRHGADPSEVDIGLKGRIAVGKFIDVDKPTFQDQYRAMVGTLGGKGKK